MVPRRRRRRVGKKVGRDVRVLLRVCVCVWFVIRVLSFRKPSADRRTHTERERERRRQMQTYVCVCVCATSQRADVGGKEDSGERGAKWVPCHVGGPARRVRRADPREDRRLQQPPSLLSCHRSSSSDSGERETRGRARKATRNPAASHLSRALPPLLHHPDPPQSHPPPQLRPLILHFPPTDRLSLRFPSFPAAHKLLEPLAIGNG